jgi:hypothetical protein
MLGAVYQKPKLFEQFTNKTEYACMKAVKMNYKVLKYIKNQTKDICLTAIKEDVHALSYIKEIVKLSNLTILEIQEINLRKENGSYISGSAILLQN